jgi:protein-L-isoaspartate(D-aspartate) O-methyltransferase
MMPETSPIETQFDTLRQQMVDQVAMHAHLVGDQTGKLALTERVMNAISRVPRHQFVPVEMKVYAYVDSPLPIGYGKTISQPFIVALMTDLLDVRPSHRVLEIGTGLGYQAAVLAELAEQVYTVEIIEELAREGERRLQEFGYSNISYRLGDGSLGWPDHAPYDRIIVTAAPDLIPPPLFDQLKPGGRMVIPAGLEEAQQLMLVQKDETGRLATEEVLPVRFSQLVTSN